ncbi:unnamed protein product [Aphis gossypii]|uniref:HAT C-terminal dimerisation domain-containing protein n=1 Tax=Aphis gossypii TaxID=80765 RepID=A0A9P0J7K1_APHGO|nr:unnamed protein product [Aphis gossypii]
MEKKMYNIFNMKKNSVQNKTVDSDCQNNSDDGANEHVEKQNITTDSNINIVITVDLGNWESGPVRPKLKLSGSKDGKSKKSKLQLHASCLTHINAMSRWVDRKKNDKCGTSIHTEIISGQKAVVESNRDYLKKIIEVTLFLARQGISFRAHREYEQSLNRGYFPTFYLYLLVIHLINIIRLNKQENVELEDLKKLLLDKTVYPNLYSLLQVALSIPVSSATCERSFSAMRRIKTWLRTSMHQERFTNLSLIHIEREISNNICTDNILDEFSKKDRRFSF